MSGDALFCLWDLEIFRSLHFKPKKNQSWNEEIGLTEIRTAHPSSEIVELPSRPRGTWRFRLVEEPKIKERRRRTTADIPGSSNALFSPNYNPYPNPNPNPNLTKLPLP